MLGLNFFFVPSMWPVVKLLGQESAQLADEAASNGFSEGTPGFPHLDASGGILGTYDDCPPFGSIRTDFIAGDRPPNTDVDDAAPDDVDPALDGNVTDPFRHEVRM